MYIVHHIRDKSWKYHMWTTGSFPKCGYFMLRSPNQNANQIRRSYKNDQSNIFVTVYFVT